MFLPVGLRLVSRLARSPRLLLLELFASFQFRLAAFAGLLFSSSCTCLVSSGTAAAWGLASLFFPYLFLWSRCRSMVLGRDSVEVLPSGWFPLAVFLEGVLPPLWRWRVWMVESNRPVRSSGRFPWCLFASILFPSCTTRGRFDVPGVLVSGSGLSASVCSHACGRFRGIALGPGAGFPFVSLPGGRVV